MAYHDQTFDKRLRQLDRAHRRAARGAKAVMRPDGLIVVRPKRFSLHFPVRSLFLLVVGFFVFKGLLLAHLGETRYSERVDLLAQGTFIEQGGAWAMMIDKPTLVIAKFLDPVIR